MEELVSEGWRLDAEAALETAEGSGLKLRSAVLDTDLKQIGGRALPLQDKTINRLVLQVDNVLNIGPNDSRGKRMLRFKLTDGHSLVTAIEYKPVSFLSDNIPPGTKVLIKGARVHSGIVLLDDRSVQVLGGRVPVLYEAWEIQRKFSGSSRSTSQRPPVFGAQAVSAAPARSVQPSTSTSKPESSSTPVERLARVVVETNPEAGPASNQSAARKLLERRAEESAKPRRRRQSRFEDENDSASMTLDEWEARRAGGGSKPQNTVNSDEDFARRLQEQLNLEAEAPPVDEAEQIRSSMFSFRREEPASKPRGRGRGRGRRRW